MNEQVPSAGTHKLLARIPISVVSPPTWATALSTDQRISSRSSRARAAVSSASAEAMALSMLSWNT